MRLTTSLVSPSFVVKAVKRPSRYRDTPPSMRPAHRSPALDSHSVRNRLPAMPAVSLLLKIVNRMPSKRARPLSVASHR